MGWSWVGETVVSPSVRPSGMRLIATSNLHCAIRPLCMLPASGIELGRTDASSLAFAFLFGVEPAEKLPPLRSPSDLEVIPSFLPPFSVSLPTSPSFSLPRNSAAAAIEKSRTNQRTPTVGWAGSATATAAAAAACHLDVDTVAVVVGGGSISWRNDPM